MTDYHKETVTQLRQILKDRGISSTGLTRKAQIVERLEEADRENLETSKEEEEATDQQHVSEEHAPATKGEQTGSTPPSVAPTSDRLPETISHIDSDMPSPNRIKTIAQTAEDTTTAEEPGAPQPAGVFNAPPADPEDVVGPRITEPVDEEVGDEDSNLAEDELPEAPGPAAEALRFARQEQELMEDSLDTTTQTQAPAADEESPIEQAEVPPLVGSLTAETSRLATEELEADIKKRKRRSGSPDLPAEEIKAKKPKPSLELVHLPEDKDVDMEEQRPGDDLNVVAGQHQAMNDVNNTESLLPESDTKREKKENTSRYKDLIQPTSTTSQDALTDDRPIVPALHPATPALYIRNFMRPLRPEHLRAHLASLASPPSPDPDPDPDIIKSLFVDAMKTHALVRFASTTAASRVRASLHGSIWPPEGNRKELWVDFVPENKVELWIQQEEDAIVAEKEARASGHPIPAKRFEVVYSTDKDDDDDNNNNTTTTTTTTTTSVTAVFQEISSSGSWTAPPPPTTTTTQPPKPTNQENNCSFATLNSLFQTTTAKPLLYFLPLPDTTAHDRLQTLRHQTSQAWSPDLVRKGRGIVDHVEYEYRYCFDDRGRLVEDGLDFGPWSHYSAGGGGRGRERERERGRGRGRAWGRGGGNFGV